MSKDIPAVEAKELYELVDPNDCGRIIDTSLMSAGEAFNYNRARRRERVDLRWIKAPEQENLYAN